MLRSWTLFLTLATALLAGCAPTLSPPYRDYEVRAEVSEDSLTRQLVEAATDAGWTTVPAESPRVVSTASKPVGQSLFSKTSAAIDLVPLDGGFVRIYVRAEKRSVLGGRSKVFALNGSLRESVLGPISASLAERGLVALGTPRDRDEDATE
ncbi:MAG: hypothetical protein Rubg2KO_34680 [Rubricoccaceae bacterium]